MARALPTLIRMAKWDVDEKQKYLNDLLKAKDDILAARNALEEEKKREEKLVKENQEFNNYYEGYINSYLNKRRNLEKALSDIDIVIDQARDVLEQAFQQLKTYEITNDNILEIEEKERELKNQKAADEMALNSHRLKNPEVKRKKKAG